MWFEKMLMMMVMMMVMMMMMMMMLLLMMYNAGQASSYVRYVPPLLLEWYSLVHISSRAKKSHFHRQNS